MESVCCGRGRSPAIQDDEKLDCDVMGAEQRSLRAALDAKSIQDFRRNSESPTEIRFESARAFCMKRVKLGRKALQRNDIEHPRPFKQDYV